MSHFGAHTKTVTVSWNVFSTKPKGTFCISIKECARCLGTLKRKIMSMNKHGCVQPEMDMASLQSRDKHSATWAISSLTMEAKGYVVHLDNKNRWHQCVTTSNGNEFLLACVLCNERYQQSGPGYKCTNLMESNVYNKIHKQIHAILYI